MLHIYPQLSTSRLGHKSFCQDVGSRQRANYPSGSSTFVGSGHIHRPVVNQHHSYWILLPITIVMILTGVLRHYATILLATPPKPASTTLEARERQSIIRGINLRNNASAALSTSSFISRKEYFVDSYKKGAFLKGGPQSRGQQAPNPMTDPAAMEGMMGMMKGNMAMMIPQTLIMSWINAFFAGFVILKLPFPLTIRFKSMLQSGVMTRDLDVRWVSSLSWYFLCLFGLQSVFIFILGNDNAASQMGQQMAQMNPAAQVNPFGPGQDPDKLFLAEAENLEVTEHFSILDGVADRILQSQKH
jgi:ER membrane protein complex subunit 3